MEMGEDGDPVGGERRDDGDDNKDDGDDNGNVGKDEDKDGGDRGKANTGQGSILARDGRGDGSGQGSKAKEAKQEISRRQVLNEDLKKRQVFEEQQLETRLLPLVWTVVGLK